LYTGSGSVQLQGSRKRGAIRVRLRFIFGQVHPSDIHRYAGHADKDNQTNRGSKKNIPRVFVSGDLMLPFHHWHEFLH